MMELRMLEEVRGMVKLTTMQKYHEFINTTGLTKMGRWYL